MKKILISSLAVSSLFANSLLNSFTSFDILDLLGDSDVSKTVGMCYKGSVGIPDLSSMCNVLNYQVSESLDICTLAPAIPGLSKKSSIETLGFGTEKLREYCSSSINDKLSSVISDGEIWSIDNELENENAKFPSGDTKEEFYRGATPVLDVSKLNKDRNDSITSMYFASKDPFHQQTAKYLIDLAKIKHVTDVSKITTADVSVASDMIEYEKQVSQLSAAIAGDIKFTSANSVSSTLATKISSYTTSAAQNSQNSTATKYVEKLKKIVEKNARNKKGLFKTLLADENDLAVPTQQTLDLYKDNIKPKYAMLIRKQQARESYIDSIVETEIKIRQDIIDLTAKKAVIMKFEFDESSAMSDIDSFVN